MSWVPFDDQFPFNRKVAGLSDAAFRLHTTAIFWCRANGTDGVIPRDDVALVVPRLRQPAKLAAECARPQRGVWHDARHECPSPDCPAPVDVDGWVIHDYFWLHPTKAEATTAQANAIAAKSDGGKLGNHRRWHTDGHTNPNCPYCPPASDRSVIGMRSDSESDTDRSERSHTDRQPIALSRSRSEPKRSTDPSVRSHTSHYAENGSTDDDLILKTIIETIDETTGRSIDADTAAKIARTILGRRKPNDPAAYCRAAIEADADPVTRFALPGPARPPWCGECHEPSRRRQAQDDGRDLGPCPKCHPSKTKELSA
jgi:hypothetical protein